MAKKIRNKLIDLSGGIAFLGMLIGFGGIEDNPIKGLIVSVVSCGYFLLWAYQNGGI